MNKQGKNSKSLEIKAVNAKISKIKNRLKETEKVLVLTGGVKRVDLTTIINRKRLHQELNDFTAKKKKIKN